MGLFSNMLDKLGFDHDDGAKAAAASSRSARAEKPAGASGTGASGAAAGGASSPASRSASRSAGAPAAPGSGAGASAAPSASTSSPSSGSSAPSRTRAGAQIDVMGQLEKRAAASSQPLNWRESIVDLMKLLDLDSSLTARKELAAELGCPPDKMGDSAQMNVWLHKEVLRKLAENGGNVPKEMLN